MAVKLVTQTVFRCKCCHCDYEWDAIKKPERCARCKLRTWNEGEDRRFKDPFQGVREDENDRRPRRVPVPQVPVQFRVERGEEAPTIPRIASIVNLLVKVRTFYDEIIQDNPCNHAKGACMCSDKKTLTSIDRMIARLKKFMGTDNHVREEVEA